MLQQSIRVRLALALIGVAGWVDAVGFVQLGNVFVSFMSGNSTQFSVGLAQGKWISAFQIGVVIFVFVLGAFLGSLVALAAGAKRLPAVLLVEAAVLAIALCFTAAKPGAFSLVALPMTLAMGIQNASISRIGDRTVSLTYVTGTLVRFAREAAELALGRGQPRVCLEDLLFWVAMVAGAVAGAMTFGHYGVWCLVVPIVCVLVIGGGSLWRGASS